MAGMRIRWKLFAPAIAISLYVSFLGTAVMGFCPGIECWPHTIAWTLLAPSLLLAIWSVRAAAIAAGFLLVAHAFAEIHVYKESVAEFWDTDQALDKCFCIVVILIVLSAFLPRRPLPQDEISDSPTS
jgi:hypothetical protein